MNNQNQKSILIILLLVIFMDSLSYFLTVPVLLRLITQVDNGLFAANTSEGIRNIAFGFAIALLPLAYLITAPIMGHYADYVGRKKIIILCLMMGGISFILPIPGIFLGSFILILMSRLFGGIASSSQPIAWAAITDISTPEKKAIYLSWAAFAMTLAMMLGPLLGTYLSDSGLVSFFDDKTPFLVALALIFINLFLIIFNFSEDNYQKLIASNPTTKHHSWKSLMMAFRDSRVNVLLLVLFVYEFAWGLYFQDIPLYLTRAYHLTSKQIFQLTSWGGVWMLFGLLVLYPITIKFFSLSKITITCLSVFSVALIFCMLGKTLPYQWIGIAPMALVVGMAYPSLLALMSDQVSANQQGWVMGAAASMLALAWMLSAMFIGGLTNISLTLPFFIMTITSILAGLIFLRWMYSLPLSRKILALDESIHLPIGGQEMD